MNNYFATIKDIVLSVGTTKEDKIKRLQSDLKCSKYEANHYYQLVMHVEGNKPKEPTTAFTLGVEIECFGINKMQVRSMLADKGITAFETGYDHNDQKKAYKLGHDGSIAGSQPCEVVSPILHNLASLKKVCEVINACGAQVNRSCGMHIHVGAAKFTVEQWVRIIKNYAAIEGIIDSFMAQSRRGDNNHYCKSIKDCAERLQGVSDMGGIMAAFYHDRYHKLNVMSYRNHKTIEFRQHQGTTDFTKIKAWAEFLVALIKHSMTNTEVITATTIDELPFLTAKQKAYFNDRKQQLNR